MANSEETAGWPPLPNSPPERASAPSQDPGRCVRSADLTAFALDDMPADRRAEVSRHLLRCPVCRAQHDAEAGVLGRLRGFARDADWESALAAALLALDARRRLLRRSALVGVAAAAAVLVAAWLAVPGAPRDERDAGRTVAAVRDTDAAAGRPTPLPRSTAAALVRAQDADGRWRASTGDERHDLGATGLAVLALVGSEPLRVGRSDAVHAGAEAAAVARGVRWIARALDADAGATGVAPRRDRAVATAALVEVYRATSERSLRPAVDRAVRALTREEAAGPAADADTARWTRAAVARARGGDDVQPALAANGLGLLAYVDSRPAR